MISQSLFTGAHGTEAGTWDVHRQLANTVLRGAVFNLTNLVPSIKISLASERRGKSILSRIYHSIKMQLVRSRARHSSRY